jgi:PAS domain S-box-containing protein
VPLPSLPSVLGCDETTAQRLALFASRAEEAIFVGGPDGRTQWANEAACRLCGFSLDELAGRRLSLFPDDADAQRAAFGHVAERFAAGETARLEASIRDRSGRVLWIELQVTPVPDGSEGRPGWVAVASDISERKREQVALAESEESYRRLVEDSPQPTAVHAGGRLVYLNRAALAVIGATSAEDVLGRPVFDFLHPDFHALAAERILKMEGVGDPAEPVHETLLRVDGSAVDVELAATPIVWRGEPAIQLAVHSVAGILGEADERPRPRELDLSSLVLELAPRIEDRIAPRAAVSFDLGQARVALAGSTESLAELVCSMVEQIRAALPGGRGGLRLRSGTSELDARERARFVPGSDAKAGRFVVFEAFAEDAELDAPSRARIFEAAFAERFPGRGPGLARALAIARAQGGALSVQMGPRRGLRIALALPAAGPRRVRAGQVARSRRC